MSLALLTLLLMISFSGPSFSLASNRPSGPSRWNCDSAALANRLFQSKDRAATRPFWEKYAAIQQLWSNQRISEAEAAHRVRKLNAEYSEALGIGKPASGPQGAPSAAVAGSSTSGASARTGGMPQSPGGSVAGTSQPTLSQAARATRAYDIDLTKAATKDLEKLRSKPTLRQKADEFLKIAAEPGGLHDVIHRNPGRWNYEKLSMYHDESHSVRLSSAYRVRFLVDDKSGQIRILEINKTVGHDN